MNSTRIKVLKDVVMKNCFEYRLIKRDHNKCIYAQHNKMGDLIAFEYFKTKLNKPHPKALEDVNNFDLVETFPSDEDFGKRAWTYRNIESAMLAFNAN